MRLTILQSKIFDDSPRSASSLNSNRVRYRSRCEVGAVAPLATLCPVPRHEREASCPLVIPEGPETKASKR